MSSEPATYVLHDLPPEPVPEADCETCATLAERRTRARAVGDGSRVSDLNVRMRKHVGEAHIPH